MDNIHDYKRDRSPHHSIVRLVLCALGQPNLALGNLLQVILQSKMKQPAMLSLRQGRATALANVTQLLQASTSNLLHAEESYSFGFSKMGRHNVLVFRQVFGVDERTHILYAWAAGS